MQVMQQVNDCQINRVEDERIPMASESIDTIQNVCVLARGGRRRGTNLDQQCCQDEDESDEDFKKKTKKGWKQSLARRFSNQSFRFWSESEFWKEKKLKLFLNEALTYSQSWQLNILRLMHELKG